MDLLRLAAALRRSWLLLFTAALMAFVVATAVAELQPAEYESSSMVDVARLLSDEDAFSNSERADRTVANELLVAGDPVLAEAAAQQLEETDVETVRRSVEFEQLPGTDTIAFTARTTDPNRSATTATAYAVAYVEARLERQTEVLIDEADEIARELTLLRAQFAELPVDAVLPQAESREDALREQYAALVSRELDLRRTARSSSEAAQFVAPAPVPDFPAGPPSPVWGAAAALLVTALGGLVVVMLSRTRDPVEVRSDVEELGLPVLAEVEPVRRTRRSPPLAGRSLEAAAVDLTTRRPIPQVVAVLSVDARDATDVVAVLAGHLRRQGVEVVVGSLSVVPRDEPGLTDGTPAPPLIAIVGDAGGDVDLRSVSRADLVLLVVRLGSTRRRDLVRVLDQVDQMTQAPRASLLVHAGAPGADGRRGGSSGAGAGEWLEDGRPSFGASSVGSDGRPPAA